MTYDVVELIARALLMLANPHGRMAQVME